MDNHACAISDAVMIDSLDTIIQQESWKLELDKTTGLIAHKSKVFKIQQPLSKNENIQKKPLSKGFKSHSCDRVGEIERLANLFTQSPGYFTSNNNNSNIDFKHKQLLLKEKMALQTNDELNNCKVLLNNQNNSNLISPDTKVRRNVRFGEYSPLNPANQANSHPFLGIGEYDEKKKKLLEYQRKEYIEYLSKAKKEKNTSNLPKLTAYSCEEAFKTAVEDINDTEQIKNMHNQEDTTKFSAFVDGVESCTSDEGKRKEASRLKQELYRFELSKQIEEKKKLELERKRKEQMEDEAIERAAREQEEKIKKEFEKEAEKRTLAELQKQFQQEKLKNEIMQKQKDLETKMLNAPAETVVRQVSKNITDCHESFEDDDLEEFNCPPESTFDNVPLPTTRVRVPRKIAYDETESRITRDVSCNTDSFKNPCMDQNISPSIMRTKMERAHVTFAKESPLARKEYNSTALLPITKSMIIDSPHALALAGLDNDEKDNNSCEDIEPTDAVHRDQISEELLVGKNHELFSDKHLLSNLGNIRKQLDIEHQRLKQQVRRYN